MRRMILFTLLLLLSPRVWSQAVHRHWRTLETAHFRLHFPAEYESWARRAAARLEGSRAAVEAAVGFEVKDRVEVLVMDPVASANGAALPILGSPRMVLWTTPPEASSSIGASRDWIELLTVHEQTHLAHILRPSRNSLLRAVEKLALPFGPIVFAPRWVQEGYATVIEGELTGSGRPNGDFRAVLLRTLARNGRMPTYAQLSSDRRSWQGMSMAYLAGSAYLEWLRDRTGPDSLRHLWARMTARHRRSFSEAFRGVFGEPPQVLYGRFVAEVTGRAMEVEREIASSLREGELFQDLTWTTEPPHVSADGKKLLTVLRSRDRPSKMVVWSTEPDQKEEKKWMERIEKILKADPEDVAPLRTRPLPRKPLHTLETVSGAEPSAPRWNADGSVIYVRREPDAAGFLHSDLFSWDPSRGEITRITRAADLSDPDPHPGGARALAVRNRHGFSQLVEIDLASREIVELTPPSIDRIYETPRWSPDGNLIAYVRHEQGRWRVIVREAAGGAERELPAPAEAMVMMPAWSADSRQLFAVIGQQGFLEIQSIPVSGGAWQAVTRSHHGSIGPTVGGDELYYLSVEIDGLDIRRLRLPQASLAPLAVRASLAPVVRPAARSAAIGSFDVEVGPSTEYGMGRQEWSTIFGGAESPSSRTVELGIRLGDVLGRSDSILVGSLAGAGSERGVALATAWRGWPVALKAHLFTVDHDLSSQPGVPHGWNGPPGRDQRGIELSGQRTWFSLARRLDVNLGLLHQSVREDGAGSRSSATTGFFQPRIRYTPSARGFHFSADLGGRWDGGEETSRWGAELAASIRKGGTRAGVGYSHHGTDDGDTLLLGGAPSSILPASARSERVLQPALPIGVLAGSEHEMQRATFDTGLLPAGLFFERHRMLSVSGSWRELSLAGAEITLLTDPLPIVKFPGLDLRLGAARIFDEPLEDETTFWLTMKWVP